MARRRRELAEHDPSPAEAAADFRRLCWLLMASEPNSPAAALSARIHAEADSIERRGGSPERQLAALWAFLDELGLREDGERLVAHLNRVSLKRRY